MDPRQREQRGTKVRWGLPGSSRLLVCAVSFTPRDLPQRIENRDSNPCTGVFIATLFTTAERWTHPNVCQWVNGYTNVAHLQNGV